MQRKEVNNHKSKLLVMVWLATVSISILVWLRYSRNEKSQNYYIAEVTSCPEPNYQKNTKQSIEGRGVSYNEADQYKKHLEYASPLTQIEGIFYFLNLLYFPLFKTKPAQTSNFTPGSSAVSERILEVTHWHQVRAPL